MHIVHAHDWQAGLVPVYSPRPRGTRPPSSRSTTSRIRASSTRRGCRGWDSAGRTSPCEGFEFYDRLSLLKAGVNFADHVTTVSPTYAEEIQRPEYGNGFDGVMQARARAPDRHPQRHRHRRVGSSPRSVPARCRSTVTDLSGKTLAKRALLEAYGLPVDDQSMARPVVGMVSRMVDQKGLDLMAALAAELPSFDASFVVLGTGDSRYQDMWHGLASWRPDRIAAHVGFDERRAHLIEGGADLFLMPSRFEPCGLNQMYSLRYGTVPRGAGGRRAGGHGAPLQPAQRAGHRLPVRGVLAAGARRDARQAALALYRGNPKAWTRLQKNGMRKDFSWDRSAAEYVKVYKRVMATRQDTLPTGPGI